MANEKPRFQLPNLVENPQGWGPVGGAQLYENAPIPFQPFNRADRFGKIADWNYRDWGRESRFQQSFSNQPSAFGYKAQQDENSFSLVDNKPKPKPKYKRFGWKRSYQAPGLNRLRQYHRRNKQNRRNNKKGNWNNRRRWNQPWGQQESKPPSYAVGEDWEVVGTFTFDELKKASHDVADATDLVTAGALYPYRTELDQLTPNNTKTLLRYERKFYTTTTSADPVIQELAQKQSGNVYATDTILAVLMAAPRSVTSWDLVAEKKGNELYLDKRNDSRIDYLTVNENWNEVPTTEDAHDINNVEMLSNEATAINHNFSQQCLETKKLKPLLMQRPNPFEEDAKAQGAQPALVAYKYRQWKVSDDITLVARCELNGYLTKKSGRNISLTVKALNEFDSKLSGNVDWRRKVQAQTSAVLATEMKNNASKLGRWTAQALINGSDQMQFGFITRVHPKDNHGHIILKTHKAKPAIFAGQIQMKPSNIWGIFKKVTDLLLKQSDGKYLILKDPNATKLHIYKVPDGVDLNAAPEESDD